MLLTRRQTLTGLGAFALTPVNAHTAIASHDIFVEGNRLTCAGLSFRCALGRAGIRLDKKEGDGATPAGTWPLREVFYRADRLRRPRTSLRVSRLKPDDGWCDAPEDPSYNRQVKRPFHASHETLWRTDHLYDLILVVGYNDAPVVKGAGSAIFIHVARKNYAPTAGCVALAKRDLLKLLRKIDASSRLIIKSA